MGLCERVEAEHRAMVGCLKEISELSGESVLELGDRLGAVMSRALGLRKLLQDATIALNDQGLAEAGETLREAAERIRAIVDTFVASDEDEDPLGLMGGHAQLADACADLVQTLRSRTDDRRADLEGRSTELQALDQELAGLTESLIAQTSGAITALQYQDPAIQELQRLDSLVQDLRAMLGDESGAVAFGRRLGDARSDGPCTPAQLAGRALSLRDDAHQRVGRFRSESFRADAELAAIHGELRSLTEAQLAIGARAAETLAVEMRSWDEPSEGPLMTATERYDSVVSTGEKLMERFDDIIELRDGGPWSAVCAASHRVMQLCEGIVCGTGALGGSATGLRDLAIQVRRALLDVSYLVDRLGDADRRIQDLGDRAYTEVDAAKAAISALASTSLASKRLLRRMQAPLEATQRGADRLFAIVVEELGLAREEVQADEEWAARSAAAEPEPDDGDDEDLFMLL